MTGCAGFAACWVGWLMLGCLLLYAAGACWFARGLRRVRGAGSSGATPTVSVVVAARDEEANIDRCLSGLRAQDYPKDLFEIIVVDDGSRDATAARVQAVPDVRLLQTHALLGWTGSKKAALSLGVQAARGELIVTTDADCLVRPGWLRALAAHFEPEVGMVAGLSEVGPRGGACGLRTGYEALDFLVLMGCIGGSIGQGHPMAASGQNLAYRRAVFAAVGGYEGMMHRGSGDDVLLLQRVRRDGRWRIRFACDEEARSTHPPAASLLALLRQRIRWASNAPCQVRLDPLFFGYMAVTYALNALVLLAPVLCLARWLPVPWALGVLAGKWFAEMAMLAQTMAVFGRRELWRYVWLWLLVQPLHVGLAGALGCLGMFRWKGSAHRWGRRLGPPAEAGATTGADPVTPIWGQPTDPGSISCAR